MKNYLIVPIIILAGAALASGETFRKTKVIDPKGKEVPAELTFNKDGKALTLKLAGNTVNTVPYERIDKLSYEKAARHRIKEGAVVMIASLGAGAVVMATKSKNHWLYVDYKTDDGITKTLTLKLDKSEYEKALATAQEHTGKEVEMLKSRKGGKEALKPQNK